MAREKHTLEGLESGVDDGIREVEPMEIVDEDELLKRSQGGIKVWMPEGFDERDIELGFCSYGELDLDTQFGAFDQRQYGVVGGDLTVDDYTPAGVEWKVGDELNAKERHRSSVPEIPLDGRYQGTRRDKEDRREPKRTDINKRYP